MNDIFDIKNVDDIPIEIKNELNNHNYTYNILELFRIANRALSIDEVTIGYYRKFKELKTKTQITSKLYMMAKSNQPKIVRIPGFKGIYKLMKEH